MELLLKEKTLSVELLRRNCWLGNCTTKLLSTELLKQSITAVSSYWQFDNLYRANLNIDTCGVTSHFLPPPPIPLNPHTPLIFISHFVFPFQVENMPTFCPPGLTSEVICCGPPPPPTHPPVLGGLRGGEGENSSQLIGTKSSRFT